MNWKVFLATFITIFLAELGDKTQIANLCMSAKSRSYLSVIAGSIIAFSAVTVVTVILGNILAKYINPDYVKVGSAVTFIVIGSLMLAGRI